MIIVIDGTNYTSDTDGLDNFRVTESYKGTNNQPDKRISSELTFKDDAYTYIKSELIDVDCGHGKYVEVNVYDDCCGAESLIFAGIIRGDGIKWNSLTCIIQARVIQQDEITEAYRCINNTVIYEGIEGISKPIVPMIPDSNIYGYGVLPSHYIRTYLQNIADNCELTLQSSIFNNPDSEYYNAIYVHSPIRTGLPIAGGVTTEWIEDNSPVKSGSQFMNDLKLLFNIDWRVRGEALIIERRDYFNSDDAWLSYDEIDISSEIDYNFTGDKQPAYMSFAYSQDGVDLLGNQLLGISHKRYQDIVEWNDPPVDLREGQLEIVPPFACPKFTNDGIGTDAGLSGSGSILLVSQGLMSLPKIIIWNESSFQPKQFGYLGQVFSGSLLAHNYPMWFNADVPETVIAADGSLVNTYAYYEGDTLIMNKQYGNLYTNFWYIEDPRRDSWECTEATFTFRFTCDQLTGYDISNRVQIGDNIGRIDRAEINYSTREMTLTVVY